MTIPPGLVECERCGVVVQYPEDAVMRALDLKLDKKTIRKRQRNLTPLTDCNETIICRTCDEKRK